MVDIHAQNRDGGKPRTFWPYLHFSVVDTVLYVDQRVFAFWDRQEDDWYLHDDGRHWAKVVIAPLVPGNTRQSRRQRSKKKPGFMRGD
jgi:hypothetical protein